MASWETVIRDGVITRLLTQMTQPKNEWDAPPRMAGELFPRQQCTILEVENIRLASAMWREVVDSSAEWAGVRLARFDFANEVGVPWEPFPQYELDVFLINWGFLGESWKMDTPITSRHLRLDPIGAFTCVDLDVL